MHPANIYATLWRRVNEVEEGAYVLIPDTIVFSAGSTTPQAYYFARDSSEVDVIKGELPGIFMKEISSNQAITDELLLKHSEVKDKDALIAEMVWWEGQEVRVNYLTKHDLCHLLLPQTSSSSTKAINLPATTWILQSFLVPPAETSYSSLICRPVLDVADTFKAHLLVNNLKYSFDNPLSLSLDADFSTPQEIPDDQLTTDVVFQSRLCQRCVRDALTLLNLPDVSFSFHFRYRESKLYFLRAEPIWTPVKPLPRQQPTLAPPLEAPPPPKMTTITSGKKQTKTELAVAAVAAAAAAAVASTKRPPSASGNVRLKRTSTPKKSKEGREVADIMPSTSHNEMLLKEVLDSYTYSDDGGSPTELNNGTALMKERSRRKVIASLYIRKSVRALNTKLQSSPTKRLRGGLKLPPWQDHQTLNYEAEHTVAERYEQAKIKYSVRNIDFSAHTPTPSRKPQPQPQQQQQQQQKQQQQRLHNQAPIDNDDVDDELVSVNGLHGIEQPFSSAPLRLAPSAPLAPRPSSSSSTQRNPNPARAIQRPGSGRSASATRHTDETGGSSNPRPQPAGFLIAPPGLPEDIIALTADIVMKITTRMVRYLSESLEFADDYRETLGAPHHGLSRILKQLGSNTLAESRNATPSRGGVTRQNVNDNDEDDSRSVGSLSPSIILDGASTSKLTPSQRSFQRLLQLLICIPNHRPADELCSVLLWLLSTGADSHGPEFEGRMHADILAGKKMLTGFARHTHEITEILSEVSDRKSQRSGSDKGPDKQMHAATELRNWILEKWQLLMPENGAAGGRVVGGGGGGGGGVDAQVRAPASPPSPSSHALPPKKPLYNGPVKRLGRVYQELSGVEPSPTSGNGTDESYPVMLLPPSGPLVGWDAGALETAAMSLNNPNPKADQLTRRVRVHMGMMGFVSAMAWTGPVLVEEDERGGNNSRGSHHQRVSMSNLVLPPMLASHQELPSASSGLQRNNHTLAAQELIGGKKTEHTRQRQETMEMQAEDEVEVESSPSLSRASPPSLSRTSGKNSENGGGLTPAQRELQFFQLAPDLTAGQRSLLLNAFLIDMAQAVLLNVSVLCRHAWAGKHITRSDLLALFGKPVFALVGSKTLVKLLEWLVANRRTNCSFKVGNSSLTELALQRMYAYWPQLSLQLHHQPLPPSAPQSARPRSAASRPRTPNKRGEGREGEASDKSSSAATSRPSSRSGAARPSSTSSTSSASASSAAATSISRGVGSAKIVAEYVWSDRYRVERAFKEPHLFVPNSNSV